MLYEEKKKLAYSVLPNPRRDVYLDIHEKPFDAIIDCLVVPAIRHGPQRFNVELNGHPDGDTSNPSLGPTVDRNDGLDYLVRYIQPEQRDTVRFDYNKIAFPPRTFGNRLPIKGTAERFLGHHGDRILPLDRMADEYGPR
jgi:hypothetical protein